MSADCLYPVAGAGGCQYQYCSTGGRTIHLEQVLGYTLDQVVVVRQFISVVSLSNKSYSWHNNIKVHIISSAMEVKNLDLAGVNERQKAVLEAFQR